MLIADRAALLLLDARGRRRLPARAAATVLAGALLSELVLRGDLVADAGTGALRARPAAAPGPRLAAALGAVTASGGDARRCVRALAARPLWDDAVAALGKSGAVRTERRRRFLVFTSVRWFPREGSVTALRTQVRAALQAARRRDRLAKARAVDPATVSLVVLLAGAGCLPAVAPHLPGGLDTEEAADVLAEARDLTPQAREALEDVETAVSVRVHALTGGDSSSDTSTSGSGDDHHGGSDGDSGGGSGGGSDGGGDGGGGGGGD
ncbi:GPP34 family phosphoprotein [Kineococcus sp. SYSU DK001]|uniref:GPP34 family phosphoprotein n=1 Tax=Kineococcus sp. SYSU DK001 TaxID=3383122 RepID=UPI003D7C9AF8